MKFERKLAVTSAASPITGWSARCLRARLQGESLLPNEHLLVIRHGDPREFMVPRPGISNYEVPSLLPVKISYLNDYQPVALTFPIMKCFEVGYGTL